MNQQVPLQIDQIRGVDDLSGQGTTHLVAVGKKHANEEVLKSLAGHDNVVVRIAVAQNPKITQAVIAILQKNPDERVVQALEKNSAVSEEVVGAFRDLVRQGVLGE